MEWSRIGITHLQLNLGLMMINITEITMMSDDFESSFVFLFYFLLMKLSFGMLPYFSKGMAVQHETLHQLRCEFGDVVRMEVFGMQRVCLFDPQDIQSAVLLEVKNPVGSLIENARAMKDFFEKAKVLDHSILFANVSCLEVLDNRTLPELELELELDWFSQRVSTGGPFELAEEDAVPI